MTRSVIIYTLVAVEYDISAAAVSIRSITRAAIICREFSVCCNVNAVELLPYLRS